jgi:tetratricopeptide (TPR) repeat protein
VGLYTVGTINRNNVWKDNFHLWSDTVKKSPDCAIAHNELASAYAAQDQLDQAIVEVQTALRLKPDSANGHISLGNLYAAQGQVDRAIAEYQTALRLKPNDYQAQKRLNAIVSQQR